MTEGREERSTALDRHETDPASPRRSPGRSSGPAPTDGVPGAPEARLPRLAVAAWAGGRLMAPAGRKGKKMRRRARKIAAALAAILVTSTFGGTAALADPSFFKASPYVGNAELIDAGSLTFDRQLAIGEPESTGGDAIAARTLEDAILTGGLSPDDMEMPDMMLAGISGDQMALAAAQDDDSALAGTGDETAEPAGDLAQAGGDTIGETVDDTAGADVTGSAGKGPAADATVDGLARDAAEGNPDGFASPALGGDPEPIVEEYAAASPPEEEPPAEESAPVGPEMASADAGDAPAAAPIPEGEAAGTAPTSETGTESGAEPVQSDELAYTPVSDDGVSDEDGSADPAPEQAAPEQTVPAEAVPAATGTEEGGTDGSSTDEST
ncbi:MAG: hypothetical protein AVDCRST_MAG01-01-2533, partial [uncultured Rubrobacteraceae bacterium]